jgi:hypothetical protein
MQLNHSGIRRVCVCVPFRRHQSLVVPIEGRWPLFHSWNKGIWPETCENGKWGDAICGFKEACTLSYRERKAPLSCGGSLIYVKEMTNSTSRKASALSHASSWWPRKRDRKVVTWLILPVVICLSQRLSHACLSINKFVLWNCEWLIKSVIVYLMIPFYMDNCGNSRANTCNQAPTSGRGVFIR